jgi:hypothetical protein
MISYEELCAALESFKARTGGQLAPPNPSSAPPLDPLTAETMMPEATLHSSGGDEGTQVGGSPSSMVYEDRSNELDIGDVLSDEESK